VVLPRTYGRGPVRPPAQIPGCRFFWREEELFARSQTHPSVAQFQASDSGTPRFLLQNCAREGRLVNRSDTERPIPCRIHQTSQKTLLFSIWCWLQCFCFLSVNAGDSRSPGPDATTRRHTISRPFGRKAQDQEMPTPKGQRSFAGTMICELVWLH
jgi:hypothetical protein